MGRKGKSPKGLGSHPQNGSGNTLVSRMGILSNVNHLFGVNMVRKPQRGSSICRGGGFQAGCATQAFDQRRVRSMITSRTLPLGRAQSGEVPFTRLYEGVPASLSLLDLIL